MSRPRCSEQWLLMRATPSSPACGRGTALSSVGRFPSNSRAGMLRAIRTSGAHLPPLPNGGQGRTTPPRPPPASPPSHPCRVHPRARQQPGLWTVGRLSRKLGPKERGHEAPAPRDQAPAPPRNLPSCARPGALQAGTWLSGELRCLAPCPPAPEGASRVLTEPPPPAAGTRSFLPRQPGRCRFDFARCSANEAAKLQLSGVGLPTHLWKKHAD